MAVQSRGVNFESIVTYIKKYRGEEGLVEFSKRLQAVGVPKGMCAFKSIDPKGWYPVEHEFKFLQVMDHLLGNGDMSRCRIFGEYTANDIGYLRLFIKWTKMSPQSIAKRALEDWPKAYTESTLKAVETSDKRIVMRLEGFPSNEYHCQNLLGLFEAIIKLSGKVGHATETQCHAKGAKFCEYVIDIE
jgi:hypothetical protein